MCAIFGAAGFRDDGLIGKMGSVMAHRGPDGSGFYGDNGRPFAMGMCRLSIIDLEGGNQPIFSEDRALVVCYNGEIYNYVELRDDLRSRGHVFATETDTEVIVHAYEEWGAACLERFNGMFAFCLYDTRTGEAFIARDRCGQKPIYYWNEDEHFIFASEAKAILESPRVSRAPRLTSIDAYLTLRYVPEPETMFASIRMLPAAHWMRVRASGEVVEIRRYWDVPLFSDKPDRSEADLVDELEDLFFDAVKICMRSDVPVGAYLSGGVDSSLIVAAMRRCSDKVHTFSIGFNSPIDETRDAAETARFLGTTHHEIQCSPHDFGLLPKIVYHMDRPVGDALIIAFYRLAQEASRDYRVVLSGEGADEMFAGYSFHKVALLVERYMRLMPGFLHRGAAMPALRAAPVALLDRFFEFPAYLGAQGKRRLVEFLGNYRSRSLLENTFALRTLWSASERGALYTDDFRAQAHAERWIPEGEESNEGEFLDRMLKLQYREWMQDWGIIRQEKNTMAHSLEVRLPFLDHRLIEFAFRLPARLKMRGMKDKIIERKLAEKILPPEVVNRPKNPFFLPMEFFFESPEVKDLIADTLSDEQIRRRGYFRPERVKQLVATMQTREFVSLKQVISLVILELWHRIFVDGQRP